MNTSLSLLPGQWRSRAAMSGVLLTVGVVLLRATRNDHWSATVGLALGQLTLGAGAWIIVRPILTVGLATLAGRRWLVLLPSLLMTSYILGVIAFAGGTVVEQILLAAYLTMPGLLLDALLVWYEGQRRRTITTIHQDHRNDHDRP